jgi:predicted  nucleic acid-binding Zn-ribbon protein
MRVRHKTPAIFTISIVDMLCCALGCVILLWLLSAKQAEEAAANVEQTSARDNELLSKADLERGRLSARIKALLDDLEKAAGLRARLESEVGSLTEGRAILASRLADLESKLKASSARVASLEGDVRSATTRLDSERKRASGLSGDLLKGQAKIDSLRGELDRALRRQRAEETRAAALEKSIDENKRALAALNRSLEEALAARQALAKTLALRDKELAAASLYKDRLTASEERERFLAKQLKERSSAMALAKETLAKLEKEKLNLRVAAENRFAGITLTGRRVIFLVDMSGSMELVDEDTPAPEKWIEVRNTVARLMRSLPELEKYQIITFSSKAEFPLGGDKWLDYDRKSPDLALKTLRAIKPKGGTNMYAALEAAFGYRSDGLDTIYLLSDGLPNLGEGLTPAQARELKELDRGVILGRYVRTMLKTSWNKPKKTRPRVKINTIGFFYESPDLGAFLWALARENDGSFVGMSKP